MKKRFLLVVAVSIGILSAKAWANGDKGNKVKVGAQFMMLSYESGTLKAEGDSLDVSDTNFGIGRSDFGLSLGYTITPTFEVGGIIGFAYENVELESGGNTDSETWKRFKIMPYLQYNIWPFSSLMVPIRAFGGYVRGDGEDFTTNAGVFGAGVGISFMPVPNGSIDILLLVGYEIGDWEIGTNGSETDLDYSGFTLGITIGLSLWL